MLVPDPSRALCYRLTMFARLLHRLIGAGRVPRKYRARPERDVLEAISSSPAGTQAGA